MRDFKKPESDEGSNRLSGTDPDFEIGFNFAINHYGESGFDPAKPEKHLPRRITPKIREGWKAALGVAESINSMA